jgi:hypothetical protein
MCKAGFPLAIFLREATFFLCRYHLLRQQDVAKWMPTKEKDRFAQNNSIASGKSALVKQTSFYNSNINNNCHGDYFLTMSLRINKKCIDVHAVKRHI